MGARGRLVILNKGNDTLGWATFFIAETVEDTLRLHDRHMWDTSLIDFPTGSVAYIDKMAVSTWNRELRQLMESELRRLFPQLEKAVWFRPTRGADRMVVRCLKPTQ